MKMLVIAALAAWMAVGSVVAASGQDILIFGDSTGKGDGAQRRWHQRMLETLPHDLVIENFSRSRSSIGKILDALEANQSKLSGTVIIYDRRNAGETADSYIAELHRAADLIGHSRFLILPQVPVSGGREDRLTLEILVAINERLLTEFAANTFDAATQSAFIADLAGDKTRSDHIHRNDVGQQIEADYISTWLSRASYREPALRTLAVHHANEETGFGYESPGRPASKMGALAPHTASTNPSHSASSIAYRWRKATTAQFGLRVKCREPC